MENLEHIPIGTKIIRTSPYGKVVIFETKSKPYFDGNILLVKTESKDLIDARILNAPDCIYEILHQPKPPIKLKFKQL